ncbi:conjugal transfer protein, partial [Escherichia coli]
SVTDCTGRKTERNVWRCLHACWPLFRHLTLPPVMQRRWPVL